MFAPAMLFSISGLMVGVSALATSADIGGDLAVYGTPWYVFWTIIQRGSWTVFKRLPLLFAVALPIGLAQKQPARCCFEALVAAPSSANAETGMSSAAADAESAIALFWDERFILDAPCYLTISATTKPIRARASPKAEPMMKTVNTRPWTSG